MPKNTDKPNIQLLSDQSITSFEQDAFGRKKFIQALANVVQSQTTKVNPKNNPDYKNIEENLVIGLYGEWGHGKTSTINLLEAELNKKMVQTVHFNSWMYSDEESMIISLFNTIVNFSGLKDQNKNEVVELLKKYQPIISALSNKADNVIKSLDKAGQIEANAYYCKEKLDKILLGTANPLVVFIDDVDRLSKDEIHILFKTLRLIASFKHVVYVVAFDIDMVSKSIKENYSGGKIEDGKAFIEKIIQIPIRIPEISKEQLIEYTKRLLNRVFNEEVDTSDVFGRLFSYYFKTPRDVKRFINSFRFTYFYIEDAIKFKDLLALEIVRTKSSDLFEIIRIYFFAIQQQNPESLYTKSVKKFINDSNPNLLNNAGDLNSNHYESELYSSFFIKIFTMDLLSLTYRSMNPTVTNWVSFQLYKKHSLYPKDGSLKNPENLIKYFNLIEDI